MAAVLLDGHENSEEGPYFSQSGRGARSKLPTVQKVQVAISEIARSVGMPNTAYFIALFKRMVGSTPNEFRQARQKPRITRTP
jgi:AraC-like DNA-binding protein